MTRHRLCIAILALTTLTMEQPALAGGNGVRLSFGGPLGTFVATPTPGYGGGSYANGQHNHVPAVKPRRPATSLATANRKRPAGSPAIVPVSLRTKEKGPIPAPVTAALNEAPGMLSRSLAAGSLPSRETVRTLPPSDLIVAHDVLEPPSKPVDSAPVAKELPNAKTAKEPVTCRKFIPAVGVTVTVGCP